MPIKQSPLANPAMVCPTLAWIGGVDGTLRLLDQTQLPLVESYLDCRDPEDVWRAIRRLSVRGAPAIGVAAAYGVVLGLREVGDLAEARSALSAVCEKFATSRPTAVNLFWALRRMRERGLDDEYENAAELREALLAEARAIEEEDREMCAAIGRHGAPLMPETGGVLTHCNAGALATTWIGTALAVIFTAHKAGKTFQVYADETRPLLQGARLTMWELMRAGVPATLICDSVAAQVMREGRIQAVITGADRIAANGDAANKIGTYGLAVLAEAHEIPFYIAAPSNTFDMSLASGESIPIEERAVEEVTAPFGRQIAPDGAAAYCPAFDVTPADLITAIITERGVIERPNSKSIKSHRGIGEPPT